MPRPLKIFTVHGHASHIPHHILNGVLGAPPHINQGHVYVVARTKKDASRLLGEKLGGTYRVTEIDEACGNHLEAFTDATAFLDTDSPVCEGTVAVSWGRGGERFAVETLFHGWKVVGETTFQDPANPRQFLRKPIFIPAPAEPKPVRITIELDASTGPELVEKLRASAALHIMTSVDGSTVLGKVVES